MSKANNLTDFLTDLANTIRSLEPYPPQDINPQDFSDRIQQLPVLRGFWAVTAAHLGGVGFLFSASGESQTISIFDVIDNQHYILSDGEDLSLIHPSGPRAQLYVYHVETSSEAQTSSCYITVNDIVLSADSHIKFWVLVTGDNVYISQGE